LPPEDPVFFLDTALGSRALKDRLVESGLKVEIYGDHFQPGVEDRVWLLDVGQRGWVVITKDQRIRYRPLELQALRRARVRVFILTSGNLTSDQIAEALLRATKKMLRIVKNHQGPFIAKIYKDGSVKMWE